MRQELVARSQWTGASTQWARYASVRLLLRNSEFSTCAEVSFCYAK